SSGRSPSLSGTQSPSHRLHPRSVPAILVIPALRPLPTRRSTDLTRGMRIVDVRHEQAAAFAAEAHGKLTRSPGVAALTAGPGVIDRKSIRLNSSHRTISYAVFCLQKKNFNMIATVLRRTVGQPQL